MKHIKKKTKVNTTRKQVQLRKLKELSRMITIAKKRKGRRMNQRGDGLFSILLPILGKVISPAIAGK